jgi:hypothetical protein
MSCVDCCGTCALCTELIIITDIAPGITYIESDLIADPLSPDITNIAAAGPQGIQGVQGTSGLQGNAGYLGADGAQGTQGLQGFGYAQLQGVQGTQGTQGLQGATGTQGTQGLQGTQGIQGVQGTTGTQGAQGLLGIQGALGTQGTQGLSIQGTQGVQGTTGLQGTQGVLGLQGTQGIQGLKIGFTYADSAPASPAIGDIWVDSTDGVKYQYLNDGNSSQWVELDSIGYIGAQGIQGLQGTGGQINFPVVTQTSSYTLQASDNGKVVSITTGGVTVPVSIFSAGDSIVIFNNSTSAQTITQGTSVTLRQAATANTGNRTLSQYGVATVLCVAAGVFTISGAGVS